MPVSHLHLAFDDVAAAATFFAEVLGGYVVPDPHGFLVRLGSVELALHSSWGQGPSTLTLALTSRDAARDLDRWVRRGATLRSGLEVRADTVNGSIQGPENLLIEVEQPRATRDEALADVLTRILADDSVAMDVLDVVADVGPDLWVCAGFVRNRVWSHVGVVPFPGDVDVDVIHVRPDPDPAHDVALERRLAVLRPEHTWSVKNQVRMARKSGEDAHTIAEALARFPETATAIAVRRAGSGIEVEAPLGLDDLFAGVVTPTPAFWARPAFVAERARTKGWLTRWPHLRQNWK